MAKKGRIPTGNPGKLGQNSDLGSGGIFFVNCKKGVAQELRRIILLHFGLVTFRLHFGKPDKSYFSWLSDLAGVTMTPKTNCS